MNNRGISPLIATVLLIAFSVALGAVVMSYGENYVADRATFASGAPEVSSVSCDNVALDLVSIRGKPQVCLASNIIELSLDNGPIAIDGIQARLLGSDDVFIAPNILSKSLDPASTVKTMFPYNSVGVPQQLKLTPILVSQAGQTFCPNKAVVLDELPSC